MIPNNVDDLCYYECFDCGNSFYTFDMPNGINDPTYCPFCGIDFANILLVERPDDLEDM